MHSFPSLTFVVIVLIKRGFIAVAEQLYYCLKSAVNVSNLGTDRVFDMLWDMLSNLFIFLLVPLRAPVTGRAKDSNYKGTSTTLGLFTKNNTSFCNILTSEYIGVFKKRKNKTALCRYFI